MNGFLTVEEVAAHLKLKARRVCELLRAGAVKGMKIGQQWRVSHEALAAYESALIQLHERGVPLTHEAITAAQPGGE